MEDHIVNAAAGLSWRFSIHGLEGISLMQCIVICQHWIQEYLFNAGSNFKQQSRLSWDNISNFEFLGITYKVQENIFCLGKKKYFCEM